jgi:hypothetical protein
LRVRRKLIGCEVICRELCHSLARSPYVVDTEFLPKALHDAGGPAMRKRLQDLIDATDASRYEAVLLGYALCGNGTAGLQAGSIPLVIPRAHDCIALLMGSADAYSRYFESHPGVYYRSIGWLERGEDLQPFTPGAAQTLEALIDKYGEDNGRYLFEQLTSYQATYTQLTYIRTGLEPDSRFEDQAQAEARRRGWSYESIDGGLGIFERLLSGDWNEREFLVVPPGKRVVCRYDGSIFAAE